MQTEINEIIEEINQQMSIVEMDYANGVEISMSVFHQMLGQIKSKAIQISENYISKGGDEKEKLEKPINLTSSQTEISDEEIEKEAIKFSEDFLGINKMVSSMSFIYACKWYREQLKKKQ